MQHAATRALLTAHYNENSETLKKNLGRPAGSLENAEDVVQEAYARALQYLPSYKPERGKFGAWFSTILTRCLKDFTAEERSCGTKVDPDTIDDEMFSEDDELFQWVTADELKRRILNKQEAHSEVLEMYFIEQYTWTDIHRVLDISKVNIKQIIYRFKGDMRNEFGRGRS